MADIYITINEDGSISIKDECAPGQEQQSMDEIRELLKDLADVGEIEHLPATKEKPRYEGTKPPMKKKGEDRARVRRDGA